MEKYGDCVPLELPPLLVIEPLSDNLRMEPVGRYGDFCHCGKRVIMVCAVDDRFADEPDRYCALQGAVALVDRCPLLRELLGLASGIV